MCDGNVDRLTIFEGKTNVTTMSKLRKENQARALRTEELSKFKIVCNSFHIFQPGLPDGLPRLETSTCRPGNYKTFFVKT